ncbi:MAG: glycoside hydrolase family 3 N-terminal domain-containing protein [Acidobacteriaceae bacterium]|nr:glycoside hydrolase family 3 N-terminal domain-containing protein [Acidobacteriaceae bacterium]
MRQHVLFAAVLLGLTMTARTQTALTNAQTERRIHDLLQRMTLAEKLGQLTQSSLHRSATTTTGPITGPDSKDSEDSFRLAAAGRLGSMLNTTGAATTNALQHEAVEHSRLHIPVLFGSDVIHGYRTIYPIPLAIAATFDPTLASALTHMAGEEAASAGIRWVYSPMADLSRDPRWGRVMESSGEDTFLDSAMTRAAVLGYQGEHLNDPTSVAACVKHFAAYGAPEAGREYASVDLSLLRIRQDYLPPYRAAIDAGAASVMAAFNTLNGVPSTSNSFLLTDTLRRDWGFQGITITDFGAIPELKNHGVAETDADAAEAALNAGIDVEMMSHTFEQNLPVLLQHGRVSMAEIDRAVRNVLRIKFALGLFDHPYVNEQDEVTAAAASHRPLARRAAEESFVLLKNNGTLPLHLSKGRTVALIGKTADSPEQMLGAWSIAGRNSDVVTPRMAFEERIKENGGKLLYTDGSSPSETAAIARSADDILVVVGEPRQQQGEATSRVELDLPADQRKMLESVTTLGKPFTVVVFSSRPLVLTSIAKQAAALLEAWAPGVEAGPALADILLGNVSPSGHLPMSFPRSVGQVPLYYAELPTGRPAGDANFNEPPTQATKYLSRYIDSPNSPLFPFGYGLTYTHFTYSDLRIHPSSDALPKNAASNNNTAVTLDVDIRNDGTHTGVAVPQLYLRNTGVPVSQPLRLLKGFQRIELAPGAHATVHFALRYQDLSFYDANAQPVVVPSKFSVWVGEDSGATLSGSFALRN